MSAPELRAPGQAGSGAHLPPAAGHGVRAVLADLFPAPAEPAARAGLARWAFLLVQVAAVAVGALVMLAVSAAGRPGTASGPRTRASTCPRRSRIPGSCCSRMAGTCSWSRA